MNFLLFSAMSKSPLAEGLPQQLVCGRRHGTDYL